MRANSTPESRAASKAKKVGVANLTPEERDLYLAYNREQGRKWRANNPERMRELSARGRAKQDPEKMREYYRDYYQRNKAKIVARAVEWRSDRRRDFAMKVNQIAVKHGVTGKIDWRELEPGECVYCGTPCESWDHVIPMSRGGSNTFDNLVPCCWPCNKWKKARTPLEWWESIKTEAGYVR